MRTKAETDSGEAEKRVGNIRRATQRQYSAEEKSRIVISNLTRGEDIIAELCRTEGTNRNFYYRWSKDFLEGGQEAAGGTTPVGK
jgi:transposase